MPEEQYEIENAIPEGWKDTEFSITQNGVTVKFQVEKLMPLQGLALFEKIRPGIGAALARINKEGMGEGTLIDIVCLFPPETVGIIMDRLFQTVLYSRESVPDATRLSGDVDSAFFGLEPIAIYEVMARCLIINFIGSVSALLSRMRGEGSPTSPPPATETFTLSSET